jgi:hypothetical protein
MPLAHQRLVRTTIATATAVAVAVVAIVIVVLGMMSIV